MSKEEKKSILADIVKNALSTGLGAASVTEEAVKNIINEISQRDSVSSLIDNAKNTRDDFISGLRGEIGSYLEKIDLESEIDRILENYDISVNANINFKKKKAKKKK